MGLSPIPRSSPRTGLAIVARCSIERFSSATEIPSFWQRASHVEWLLLFIVHCPYRAADPAGIQLEAATVQSKPFQDV